METIGWAVLAIAVSLIGGVCLCVFAAWHQVRAGNYGESCRLPHEVEE